MSKSAEKLNQSKGEKIKLPCAGSCSGKTLHDVVLSVDVNGCDDEHDVSWNDSYQIVRCCGCERISFRSEYSNSEDYVQVGENEYEHAINEELYPSRIEGRKDLGLDIVHLPQKIQRIYRETLQALNGKSPILAGIGLRALIEAVCKENNATGNDLYKRIDDLVAKNILTPNGSKILHKVRALGNEAAHEVKPHKEKSLGLAMNVVEHLLQDVYILPKQVAAEFDD